MQDDLFGGLPLTPLPEKKSKKSAAKKPKESAKEVDLEKHSEKVPSAFRTIGEVALSLGVEQHVLRFWEGKFSQIKPLKMSGNRRYYRPEDIDILIKIKDLLHNQGYTIKGAQKAFGLHVEDLAESPTDELAENLAQDMEPAAEEVNIQPKISKTSMAIPKLSDNQIKQVAEIHQELLQMRRILQLFTNL